MGLRSNARMTATRAMRGAARRIGGSAIKPGSILTTACWGTPRARFGEGALLFRIGGRGPLT